MPAVATKKGKEVLAPHVAGLVDRFTKVEQYWQPAVLNAHENWRYYWGLYASLGQGQWPANTIVKMTQSGRQLTQYNFILPIVDALLATIFKMPMEPQLIPLDDVGKQLSDLASHMIYSDRELMDWSVAFREFGLFSLIFEGVMKMVVSDRYDPLGNIGFENCPQGSVYFDPYWKSGRRKDLKRVWKKSWMSAEEIYRIYKTERAQVYAQSNRLHGEEYGPFTGINPFDQSSQAHMLGTYHLVYEEYFMDVVDRTIEIIHGQDGEMEMPDIPDEDKPEYLDHFLKGWDKTSVHEEDYKTEECFVRTACPTMTGNELLVDKERTEVQIGSPPFFVWAANRVNGQSRGIVDSLKDAQTNQNFIEAEIIRKIQTEGGGGSKWVDESLIHPQDVKKFHLYSNRPDMKFRVKPGTLRKGLTPSQPLEVTGVPAALYQNLQHIQRDIVPNISKRPPVTMGKADDGTDPSGKLFSAMSLEAESQVETMVSSYRDLMNDVYEAHLLQAGQTYSNEMLPREFLNKKKSMIANMPVETSEGVTIANDVRGLMKVRHKIIISDKQASPSAKASTANLLVNYNKTVPPEAVGTKAVINQQIIKNIEQLDDEAQAKLDEMSELEQDVARAQLMLSKTTLEIQLLQAEQQKQMMQTQMQAPMPPAPGQNPQQPPAQQQLSRELQTEKTALPSGEVQPITQGVQQ